MTSLAYAANVLEVPIFSIFTIAAPSRMVTSTGERILVGTYFSKHCRRFDFIKGRSFPKCDMDGG